MRGTGYGVLPVGPIAESQLALRLLYRCHLGERVSEVGSETWMLIQ